MAMHKVIIFRADEAWVHMLERLTQADDRSTSAEIRWLIRKAAEKLEASISESQQETESKPQ